MQTTINNMNNWVQNRIKPQQVTKYLNDGKCFIDDAEIESNLLSNKNHDPARIKDILQKSLAVQTLTPAETACLLNVQSPEILAQMAETVWTSESN